MGRKVRDLTGQRFDRLEVIKPDGFIGKNAASLCKCNCGNLKRILNMNLKSGNVRSCGCLQRESASTRVKKNPPRLKHGLRRTGTYSCWIGMVGRCNNPADGNYPRYGAKGIIVCQRWSDPDKGLLNFVEDMGHRPTPGHSIDRIDSTKGYEPNNCRWATRFQQNQNVGLKSSNTSGYKGISPYKDGWKAEIRNDGKRHHLGCFATKDEAALAYNIASEKLHGLYGVPNVLPTIDRSIVKKVYQKVVEVLSK